MKHFKTIFDFHKSADFPPPKHSLFSIILLSNEPKIRPVSEITCDFYIICLKKLKSGVILYGRTKYDHEMGSMFFLKPRQILGLVDSQLKERGYSILFHEDFLMGHSLFSEIKRYGYFDYETNEALHLSEKEEKIMWSLFQKIDIEYHNDPDEFSKSIILSHLDSILKYAQRFYKRQFIDRKLLSGVTITKFNECLNLYFEKSTEKRRGLPTVRYIASQLHHSPKYLSDLLKQETGKTSLELIHLYVISEAKNMLVAGDQNISEIAYQLGFKNPSYFSRLFKKEAGISPSEFKNQHVKLFFSRRKKL